MRITTVLLASALPCAALGQGLTPPKGPTPIKLPTPAPAPSLTILEPATIYPYSKVALKMRIDHYPFEDLDRNRLPLSMGDFKRISSITYAPPAAPGEGWQRHVRRDRVLPDHLLHRPHPRDTSRNDEDWSGLDSTSRRADAPDRKTYSVSNPWSLRSRFAPKLVHFGIGVSATVCPPSAPPLASSSTAESCRSSGAAVRRGRPAPSRSRSGSSATGSWAGSGGSSGRARARNATRTPAPPSTRRAAWPSSVKTARRRRPHASVGRAEVSSDGLVFAHDNTDPVSVLKPALVQYSCPITLGTDVRTIRFTLDEVTFLAAPGRTFP